MQRILYYIFIYNILFEGFFEGKKQPPTSLRRGREEETKRHFQSANLGGYKKGNAERRGLFGEIAPKSGQMRRWGVRFLAPMGSIISRKYARKMKNAMVKKGVLMCEETFVRKIFIQLRPMEPIRRA